jgi:hypothetical protein
MDDLQEIPAKDFMRPCIYQLEECPIYVPDDRVRDHNDRVREMLKHRPESADVDRRRW